MDWQGIAIGLLTVVMTIGGWTMNRLFQDVDALKKELQRTELEAARRYVDKEDLEGFKTAVFEKLDKFGEKMEKLAVNFAATAQGRTGI